MARETNRENIIKRIKAFLAMTVERGASENEAAFAAKNAAQLLAEYDLSYDDLQDQRKETGVSIHFDFSPVYSRFMHHMADAIKELCMIKVLISGPAGGRLTLIGNEIDVKFAQYLCAICVRALANEEEKTLKVNALMRLNIRRRQVESVLQGMSARLAERMKDVAWARRTSSGNALVVVKDDVIDETMLRLGIKTREVPLRKRFVDPLSYKVGIEAADRVSLENAIHSAENDDDASGVPLIER